MCQPDKQVVTVCGDGAFQMAFQELATARVNDVPMKVAVIRNSVLGLVREYQEKSCSSRYEGIALYDYPKYEHIAAAYDMKYIHISSNAEIEEAIDRFLETEEPCLMVVDVDRDDNVK